MLILGSPAHRQGRTCCFIWPAGLRANLTENDALIILDPTGEYYNALYQKGDVVFADDKRATGPDGPECWNLFEELTDDSRLIEDASALFGLLFEDRIQSAAHPFYPTAARDLIMALAVYLKRRGDSELCTCQALRELIDGFDMESMCQILDAAPEFRAFASYLGEGERAQGVVAHLQQAARELLAGRFGSRGTLGIRKLMRARGGRTIFVCYDPARGPLTRPVFAALMDLCLTEALSRVERDGTVTLLLDGPCVPGASASSGGCARPGPCQGPAHPDGRNRRSRDQGTLSGSGRSHARADRHDRGLPALGPRKPFLCQEPIRTAPRGRKLPVYGTARHGGAGDGRACHQRRGPHRPADGRKHHRHTALSSLFIPAAPLWDGTRRAFLSSLLPWFDLKSAAPERPGCRAFALCSYR